MPALRHLPPQFLLPAWNLGQLHQLRGVQFRNVHAVSNLANGTGRQEEAETLKLPASNKPLIRKTQKRPTGQPAGRPPKKSATAFTSLRPEEPGAVSKSGDRDVIQNVFFDGDLRLAPKGAAAVAGRKSRSSSTQTLQSTPNRQTPLRKVALLRVRQFEISRPSGVSDGQQSAAMDKNNVSYNDASAALDHRRSALQKNTSRRPRAEILGGGASAEGKNAIEAPIPRVPPNIAKVTPQGPHATAATQQEPTSAPPLRVAPTKASLGNIQKPAAKKLSLFEELFPEEAQKSSKTTEHEPAKLADLPLLPPLDFNLLPESFKDYPLQSQPNAGPIMPDDSSNTFRQEGTTILICSRASTSLSEADFRGIVPIRGEHIEAWRGPGDILKVIPARDMATLSPKGHYFLLFPNLAYAQAYQNYALRLHRLAQTYNPTSLDWSLSAALDKKNKQIKSKDIPSLLQDYTLSPPSVRVSLRVLDTPYKQNVRKVLDYLGYPQIVTPDDKAGRAVLFWVAGYQPSTLSVKTMLAKDGQDRGLQWGPLRGCGSIDVFDVKPGEDDDDETEAGFAGEPDSGRGDKWQRDEELKPKRNRVQRWIISFEDEAEARRFVRVWHRMPYMFPLQTDIPSRGEENMLVHAEFLW